MPEDNRERDSREPIPRRQFLKGMLVLGGTVALASLLPSCFKNDTSQVVPSASIKPSPSLVASPLTGGMTTVALVRTQDRSQGVQQAVRLLGLNSFQGKKVVLKPNFNSADPTPGSTHIDTLRSLIQVVQQMGAKDVTLAERSGPGDSTRTVMQKKGVFNLAEELDFNIVNLEEVGADGWKQIIPKDSHWKNGFLFPKLYSEAEAIVSTCCLKTHAYGGQFTLSLKNSVGLVPRVGQPYMNELHSSNYQRQMIAEINAAYSPDLVVLDGVEAFVEGGPAVGKKVSAGVVLAGTDRIAIDATGVAILRLLGTTPEVSRGLIFAQDQIARAVELGLGVSSPSKIRLVTADQESQEFASKVNTILQLG